MPFEQAPPKPAKEAEGLTEEHMLSEHASDYARELADLSVSSDPAVVEAAVPQFVANLKKELSFLDLSDDEAREAILNALVDLQLDPQLASGVSPIEMPKHASVAIDALRAWKPKSNGGARTA